PQSWASISPAQTVWSALRSLAASRATLSASSWLNRLPARFDPAEAADSRVSRSERTTSTTAPMGRRASRMAEESLREKGVKRKGTQSKTWRTSLRSWRTRSVLDCGSPLPLLVPGQPSRRGTFALGKSRFDRDVLPVDVVTIGVVSESLFVFNQNRAHHGRLVRMTEFGNEIGNQILLPVGVDQGKYGAGSDHKRQIVFRALGEVLDDVGEEFQLLHQVRVFRGVDLREFHLQKRELLVHAPQYLRRDLRGAVMNELYNLGHGPHHGQIPATKQVV